MKLSIIVPVYNMAGDNKLKYCLDSLVSQTLSDYEIIAVNDASTDDSLHILNEYAQKYPSVLRVLSLDENHKQGGAKNKGLDICKGDFIGFVDADDWVTSDMYKKLTDAADKSGADVAVCNLTMTSEHSMKINDVIEGINPEAVGEIDDEKFRKLINNSGYMVVKIFARHIFEEPKLRFPEHMFYEDNAIGMEVLHRAKKIEYVKEPMYYYYQHGGSTVHTLNRQMCEYRMEAMRIGMQYAIEGGYLDKFKKEIEFKFINLFYQNTLFSYMQGRQKHEMSFIRKMGKEMKNTFPDFEKNEIYLQKVNAEEKKLMHMQQKSTLLFVVYYKILWFYRRKIRHIK